MNNTNQSSLSISPRTSIWQFVALVLFPFLFFLHAYPLYSLFLFLSLARSFFPKVFLRGKGAQVTVTRLVQLQSSSVEYGDDDIVVDWDELATTAAELPGEGPEFFPPRPGGLPPGFTATLNPLATLVAKDPEDIVLYDPIQAEAGAVFSIPAGSYPT